jgi:hypothetical protein
MDIVCVCGHLLAACVRLIKLSAVGRNSRGHQLARQHHVEMAALVSRTSSHQIGMQSAGQVAVAASPRSSSAHTLAKVSAPRLKWRPDGQTERRRGAREATTGLKAEPGPAPQQARQRGNDSLELWTTSTHRCTSCTAQAIRTAPQPLPFRRCLHPRTATPDSPAAAALTNSPESTHTTQTAR